MDAVRRCDLADGYVKVRVKCVTSEMVVSVTVHGYVRVRHAASPKALKDNETISFHARLQANPISTPNPSPLVFVGIGCPNSHLG